MSGKASKHRASSNWLSLQKTLKSSIHAAGESIHAHRTKRRRVTLSAASEASTSSSVQQAAAIAPTPSHAHIGDAIVNGESTAELRSMIYAPQPHGKTMREKDRLPGLYVALDCEMVGVGPAGSESSLARVSIVNYCGAVLLDVFVRQKERVTDWRTRWSGVRERDMVNARSFEEVQLLVADLISDRVLIGHAIQNDTKVLMLSHPRTHIRDTQHLAHKHGQSRAPRPALRNLVRDMLGVSIQDGEHSSVIDARATMAVYRLHRKEWERAYAVIPMRVSLKGKGKRVEAVDTEPAPPVKKRKRERKHAEDDGESESGESEDEGGEVRVTGKASTAKAGRVPVQRKGTSSGLSTIVTRGPKVKGGGRGGEDKVKWWKELGGGGAKGSVRMSG